MITSHVHVHVYQACYLCYQLGVHVYMYMYAAEGGCRYFVIYTYVGTALYLAVLCVSGHKIKRTSGSLQKSNQRVGEYSGGIMQWYIHMKVM